MPKLPAPEDPDLSKGIQNSCSVPKYRPTRRAVSAETARSPRRIAVTRFAGTRMARASWLALMLLARNSSLSEFDVERAFRVSPAQQRHHRSHLPPEPERARLMRLSGAKRAEDILHEQHQVQFVARRGFELPDQVPVEVAGLRGFGVDQQPAAADLPAHGGSAGDHVL